jgi:hypothetical protein
MKGLHTLPVEVNPQLWGFSIVSETPVNQDFQPVNQGIYGVNQGPSTCELMSKPIAETPGLQAL